MRTTIDIEDPILKELRALQKREGITLGALVSRLLAHALARRKATPPAFTWTAKPMRALVTLEDKEAVYAALDEDPQGAPQ